MTKTDILTKDWISKSQPDLESAIAAFKAEFPGWYYMLGECQVSCDATIAPTTDSEDIALIPMDERFDSGFSVDLRQPSTLAQALLHVALEARDAKVKL